MHMIKITGGGDQGSISCCNVLATTPEEEDNRKQLLQVIAKTESILTIYLVPDDPRKHQTIYVGKGKYAAPETNFDRYAQFDAPEYLLNNPLEALVELIQAFLRDPMTREMRVETTTNICYSFTKTVNDVGC